MASVLSFSTIAGGVFIEDNGTDSFKPSDRCFRFDSEGNSEWATFAALTCNDPSPRFYSHVYNRADFEIRYYTAPSGV